MEKEKKWVKYRSSSCKINDIRDLSKSICSGCTLVPLIIVGGCFNLISRGLQRQKQEFQQDNVIVWGAEQGARFHQPEPRRRGQKTTVRRGNWLLSFYQATFEEQDCLMYKASPQSLTPPIHVFPRWRRWQLPRNNFSLLMPCLKWGWREDALQLSTVCAIWIHIIAVFTYFWKTEECSLFLRDKSDAKST